MILSDQELERVEAIKKEHRGEGWSINKPHEVLCRATINYLVERLRCKSSKVEKSYFLRIAITWFDVTLQQINEFKKDLGKSSSIAIPEIEEKLIRKYKIYIVKQSDYRNFLNQNTISNDDNGLKFRAFYKVFGLDIIKKRRLEKFLSQFNHDE